jgi:hypothetical protein
MRTTRKRNTGLYLLLFAVQITGAICFIWQTLLEFRLVAEYPGDQLPRDGVSDLISFDILRTSQIAFWYRVLRVPIPSWHPQIFLNHVLLFPGRLSFIFGSTPPLRSAMRGAHPGQPALAKFRHCAKMAASG